MRRREAEKANSIFASTLMKYTKGWKLIRFFGATFGLRKLRRGVWGDAHSGLERERCEFVEVVH